MRIKIMIGVAAALGLVLLLAGYGDRSTKNNSQAAVSAGTVYIAELPLRESQSSVDSLTRI